MLYTCIPARDHSLQKVHHLPCLLLPSIKEVDAIIGLLDPEGVVVGVVLQYQLLQVEKSLLVCSLCTNDIIIM